MSFCPGDQKEHPTLFFSFYWKHLCSKPPPVERRDEKWCSLPQKRKWLRVKWECLGCPLISSKRLPFMWHPQAINDDDKWDIQIKRWWMIAMLAERRLCHVVSTCSLHQKRRKYTGYWIVRPSKLKELQLFWWLRLFS